MSEIVKKLEEARNVFGEIENDYTDPSAMCNRGAALITEAIAALQPSSAEREELAKRLESWGRAWSPSTPDSRAQKDFLRAAALLRTLVAVDDAMVLIAAKAINKHGEHPDEWEDLTEEERVYLLGDARAALEAALQAGRK